MLRFDEILGQRSALALLSRMLGTGRVPQALLFGGAGGVGKGCIALSFAAALLCDSPTPEACGRCDSCRMAERGGHPDLLVVTREPSPKKPSVLRTYIVVDQIRTLSQVASLAPRLGRRRLFIVDPADRMNGEAQNALLKTLEEPPGKTVLILVASRPRLLLPTVRSRCFAVGFGPLRPSELAARLESRGMSREESVARAALGEGCPGRALGLDLESLTERRAWILNALEELAASPPRVARLAATAEKLAGKDQGTLSENLEIVEALLRDAALAVTGLPDALLSHADLSARLRELGRSLGAERAAQLIASAERLRNDLRLNLNRALVAEGLLAAVAGAPIP